MIQSPYTSSEKRLMPALSGLQNQMSINPTQQESFDRNESRAKKIAEKVHLVHVSSTKEVSFDELLIQPPHAIPTSEHLTYCSDATRRAENLLGLARSAYFYAGRACPAYEDPEKVFTLDNTWRAWTFEVRFAEPQQILDRVAWTAKKSQLELLRRKQAAQPVAVPGDPISVLDQFLNQPPLNPVGSDVFCEDLELWIVGQVGV
ncbi:MAG: hypothetical protein WKF77_13680 [Planctomycetaceae bacterium]